jgi:hypothetical protein
MAYPDWSPPCMRIMVIQTSCARAEAFASFQEIRAGPLRANNRIGVAIRM